MKGVVTMRDTDIGMVMYAVILILIAIVVFVIGAILFEPIMEIIRNYMGLVFPTSMIV